MTTPASLTCCVCDKTTPGDRWAKVRAQHEGWFSQKDGTNYCPAHVPAWVAAWRDNQNPS